MADQAVSAFVSSEICCENPLWETYAENDTALPDIAHSILQACQYNNTDPTFLGHAMSFKFQQF
jgi:hypothetical protein